MKSHRSRDHLQLRDRLRAETRAEHGALEAVLPIARPEARLAAYRDHLRFLLGFHEPMEARLRGVPDLARMLPDLADRWKTGVLRRDLGPVAAGPRPAPEIIPDPRKTVQALGVLYVLEGATLGSRVLLPRLREAGVIPGEIGQAYLVGYGPRTPIMWTGVCEALEKTDPGDADEVVAWARQTFVALRAWRAEWEDLR